LNARDVTLAVISARPLSQIQAFQKRMGWKFTWFPRTGTISISITRFPSHNRTSEKGEPNYNFNTIPFKVEEGPGLSAFYKDEAGNIFHTLFAYARGLDILIGAYNFLDFATERPRRRGLPSAWPG